MAASTHLSGCSVPHKQLGLTSAPGRQAAVLQVEQFGHDLRACELLFKVFKKLELVLVQDLPIDLAVYFDGAGLEAQVRKVVRKELPDVLMPDGYGGMFEAGLIPAAQADLIVINDHHPHRLYVADFN